MLQALVHSEPILNLTEQNVEDKVDFKHRAVSEEFDKLIESLTRRRTKGGEEGGSSKGYLLKGKERRGQARVRELLK